MNSYETFLFMRVKGPYNITFEKVQILKKQKVSQKRKLVNNLK